MHHFDVNFSKFWIYIHIVISETHFFSYKFSVIKNVYWLPQNALRMHAISKENFRGITPTCGRGDPSPFGANPSASWSLVPSPPGSGGSGFAHADSQKTIHFPWWLKLGSYQNIALLVPSWHTSMKKKKLHICSSKRPKNSCKTVVTCSHTTKTVYAKL